LGKKIVPLLHVHLLPLMFLVLTKYNSMLTICIQCYNLGTLCLSYFIYILDHILKNLINFCLFVLGWSRTSRKYRRANGRMIDWRTSRFYIANVIILLLSFNSFSFNTYNTFSFSIHWTTHMLLLTLSFNAYELLSVITYITCFVKLLLCYINH